MLDNDMKYIIYDIQNLKVIIYLLYKSHSDILFLHLLYI